MIMNENIILHCKTKWAESLRLAMKSKGVDKSNPMLYEKIEYYSKLLYSKGAKTKAEAEKIYSV